ncbi:MAG: NAD(P)-dependent alcohol dehydrogenase [Bacteroidetes bacterium]|nr:MAG: NAD(P)-dependent alcohol dehydrogenase [Bacteroidota bacterium]
MKAITIQAGDKLSQLQLSEQAPPSVGPGEVLVRWHATSLNFHDYLVGIGAIPVAAGRIPMSDGAGEIIALGAGVENWQVGDRVMSLFFPQWLDGAPTAAKVKDISGETVDGYLVEQSAVSAQSLTRIPAGYTYAEAATLPCAALTAWRALMVEGQLRAGQSVLIEGSGGMSIFGLQLAKAAGAEVFATTSSERKAERLRALGASQVFNYRSDERWGKTIFKETGGVDHVLDVGGGSTMVQSIEAAAMGGHIVSIGILGNGRKGELTFPKLFFKHLRLSGIAVGSRTMQEDMVRAIELNRIRPIVDRSFAMDEIADAFRYQESGQHFGKIVVEY